MYRHRIQLLKQQERVLNWTRGTPRESSGAQILNQVIHLLKYYFFCKHIRNIVNASIRALSSGRVSVQIHFISNPAKGKDLIEDIYKNFPFFWFSVVFSLFKKTQPSIHFRITNVSDRSSATWVDIALLLIYKDIPPIISEYSDKEVTQDEWSKSFWRRPIKRSIVNSQPSLNKLTVNIDAFGISKGSELVIEGINNEGKHITKEFGETIYEFLIRLT
ncbi:mediator of RNA polymerase II transcription subunit 17 [Gigaspora margarita]|uniref:Mediator of RNA polymerase II transcription subunit 17 n=1 Tax=Gigaspora margarita TaxID=4874 RepID=A0A8H4AR30_GIGMA|nr:mediator of RNA polymerase II transcription subunit 17 [Gigaspora margarita]